MEEAHGATPFGGVPHSASLQAGRFYAGMVSFVQTALLAAAPLEVWQGVWHAPRRAIADDVAQFSGRRGCGT